MIQSGNPGLATNVRTSREALVRLVEHYFRCVDNKDLDGVLACFESDARFQIPTHELVFSGGNGEIRGMFERLFARYDGIWHGEFEHIVEAPDRVASQFRVRNTTFAGNVLHKNNANVFRICGNRFTEVFVYMAGDNSLT